MLRFFTTFLLGLATFPAAAANYSFTVVPSAPEPGQWIQIHVTSSGGACEFPLPDYLNGWWLGNDVMEYQLQGAASCTPNVPPQECVYRPR